MKETQKTPRWQVITLILLTALAFLMAVHFDPERVDEIILDGLILAEDIELWVMFVFYPQIIAAHGFLCGLLIYGRRKHLYLAMTAVMELAIPFVTMLRDRSTSFRNVLIRTPVVALVYFVLTLVVMKASEAIIRLGELIFVRNDLNTH